MLGAWAGQEEGRLEEAIADVYPPVAALLLQEALLWRSQGLGCPLVPPPPQVSRKIPEFPEKGENIKVHVFSTRSAVGTNISTFNQEGCGNYKLEQ